MEQLVDFNTAQALKEVGYNMPTEYFFHKKSTFPQQWPSERSLNTDPGYSDIYIDCPEMYDVAVWLRKMHKIHLVIDVSAKGSWNFKIKDRTTGKLLEICAPDAFPHHDFAFISAIKQAVEIVKEKSAKA